MFNSWIRSPSFDTVFILLPSFLITAVVCFFPTVFQQANQEMPVWSWVLFVLLIDVAHVYGTLYRTYFDRSSRAEYGALLWVAPFVCWIVGIVLYSLGAIHFWQALAYIAVFHFVRQQYGFVRIYSRAEKLSRFERGVFACAVYAATLYPLISWHTHLPRAFSWLIDGDFFKLPFSSDVLTTIDRAAFVLYLAVLGLYVVVEARRPRFNLGRMAIVSGTAVSWYVGIVVLNGDLAFTATNVVAHGIPYMALSWNAWRKPLKPAVLTIAAFVLSLAIFAYCEEWLWDILVWRDHPGVFLWRGEGFDFDLATQAWLVPLLALPQSTHYILDGFIWKLRGRPDAGLSARVA